MKFTPTFSLTDNQTSFQLTIAVMTVWKPEPAEVVVGKVKAHRSKMSPCGM